MNKRLIIILALAFVLGLAFGAYAEVQNVKVSGDITAMGIARDNLDLRKTAVSGSELNTSTNFGRERDLASIVRLRVDADLTDNVSTTIRLLNERNWGDTTSTNSADSNIFAQGTTIGDQGKNQNIDLDLAYVTLKEFLYSPLTLTIGRQNLRFGTGLVVGDPDTNIYSARTALAEGDLSGRKSFDAIRATLNYDPLVIDGIFAKVEEGRTNLNDDVTLAGLNANYALNNETTLEGFFFSKIKGSNAAAVYNIDYSSGAGTTASQAFSKEGNQFANRHLKDKADKVHTVGARVVNKSIKNLSLDVQAAYQFGTYNPKFDPNAFVDMVDSTTPRRETANRSAWAVEVSAAYDLKDIAQISKYSPVVTGIYQYLSGAERDQVGNKKYKGWDPMFEDQTAGHLMNAIFANTNHHLVGAQAKAKLTDDIGLDVGYYMAWFAKRYPEGRLAVLSGLATSSATAYQFRMGKERYIGQEIDATLTYDYTEDVQFSLLGGIFLPGKSINEGYIRAADGGTDKGPDRACATELIGSMKVTF